MCVAIAMLSCETSRIANHRDRPNTIAIITVDCRSDQQIHQSVVQLLKLARVMEWKVNQQEAFETIEARYENLSDSKAAEIEDFLMRQFGVSQVTVRWETGMVSLVPQKIPTQSGTVWPGQ